MMEEELTRYLARYNEWEKPVPAGWQSMLALPLNAREAEFLFDDGAIRGWPISHTQFLISPQRPIAWRNPVYRDDLFRRRIIAWASNADDAGLWAVVKAIKSYEKSCCDARVGDYGAVQ